MPLPITTRRGDTLWYDREQGVVQVLDRRRPPREKVFVTCRTVEDVAQAIEQMIVQGGPPLAYVGGYGMALAARAVVDREVVTQRAALHDAAERLTATRPTADDLQAVVGGAQAIAQAALNVGSNVEAAVVAYVQSEVERGDQVSEICGRNAAQLLSGDDVILTHCFAGAALNWMLHVAFVEQNKAIRLVCNETRPYLQGARLAAAAAIEIGVPATVITDNMAGYCFSQGMFTKYVTAADRIAMDGSAANKVGTYQYAVLARRHVVPFYVLGYDGPDLKTADGKAIPIELRDPAEVLFFNGVRVAAEGAEGFYPAFDVTPPELITAIVTDRGTWEPAQIAAYHGSPSGIAIGASGGPR